MPRPGTRPWPVARRQRLAAPQATSATERTPKCPPRGHSSPAILANGPTLFYTSPSQLPRCASPTDGHSRRTGPTPNHTDPDTAAEAIASAARVLSAAVAGDGHRSRFSAPRSSDGRGRPSRRRSRLPLDLHLALRDDAL